MSTTPQPISTIKSDFSWLQHHLVVAFLALVISAALVYGAVNTVDGIITRHDEKKDAIIQKILDDSKANQAAALATMSDYQKANALKDAQTQATIDSLLAQVAADRAALKQQLQKDSTLDAQGAAARLVEQEHANPSQAKAVGDTVVVDLPLTRQIVSDLDKKADDEKELTNTNAQLDAQKTLTADAKQNFENAQKVIAADKDTLIKQIQADAADCKVQVDKERTAGNKKGFWGYVAGVASAALLLLHH